LPEQRDTWHRLDGATQPTDDLACGRCALPEGLELDPHAAGIESSAVAAADPVGHVLNVLVRNHDLGQFLYTLTHAVPRTKFS
jgi:hypothetical protein